MSNRFTSKHVTVESLQELPDVHRRWCRRLLLFDFVVGTQPAEISKLERCQAVARVYDMHLPIEICEPTTYANDVRVIREAFRNDAGRS